MRHGTNDLDLDQLDAVCGGFEVNIDWDRVRDAGDTGMRIGHPIGVFGGLVGGGLVGGLKGFAVGDVGGAVLGAPGGAVAGAMVGAEAGLVGGALIGRGASIAVQTVEQGINALSEWASAPSTPSEPASTPAETTPDAPAWTGMPM